MVALYGIALDRADIVPLVGELDELLAAAGQPLTHVSVTARGFGKRPLLFDKAWKRLQKTAPEELGSVHMYSLVEGWHTLSDWRANAIVHARDGYFNLGAGLATVPDAEQRIMGFTRRWLERLRPAYGIGFLRARGQGPSFYGLGVGYGAARDDAHSGPAYEERLVISRWSYIGMADEVYRQGMQRDVYPYNVLTRVHLQRDIGGQSLDDWIRAEPWRGELTECPGGYALWTVAAEHIPEIRRQLTPSGILFVTRPEIRT